MRMGGGTASLFNYGRDTLRLRGDVLDKAVEALVGEVEKASRKP